MSIAPVGGANNAYLVNAAMQAKQNNNMESAKPQLSVANDGPAKLEQNKVETKSSDSEPSTITSFGYGVLGMDKPNEVEETEDGAYTAGQVLKAIGTVGSIIAILV
ncbi:MULTISPECIES: hypothetical protein [unclassified Agarivorans]|uniref:hypothetical protein n=1 Tax=unclassified Agarivorans TaxID=2636026 RepID=UPI003D7E935A